LKEASLIGMKVLKISCGENHSLALIEIPNNDDTSSQTSLDNSLSNKVTKLFVWGSNDKW
jgi:hypothetical protein